MIDLSRGTTYVQDNILHPVNALLEGKTFSFPLDKKYFGDRPLLVEFPSTSTFSFNEGLDRSFWLNFVFRVAVPFTLTADNAPGLNINDSYAGTAFYYEVAARINTLSVLKLMQVYFGHKVMFHSGSMSGGHSYVLAEGILRRYPYRVFATSTFIEYPRTDPIFQGGV